MFTWYRNYCYSRPVALRIFYGMMESPEEDRWSHLDKPKRDRQGFHMSGGETVGLLVGSSAFSGWLKNVGKEHSNIINDTAQSAANTVIFLFLLWLAIGIFDGLLRLPYFLITQPRNTLRVLNKWLVVRFGDTHPFLVIVWWILVPALVLDTLGLLDWAYKYF